jgi:hypothetical protein
VERGCATSTTPEALAFTVVESRATGVLLEHSHVGGLRPGSENTFLNGVLEPEIDRLAWEWSELPTLLGVSVIFSS